MGDLLIQIADQQAVIEFDIRKGWYGAALLESLKLAELIERVASIDRASRITLIEGRPYIEA